VKQNEDQPSRNEPSTSVRVPNSIVETVDSESKYIPTVPPSDVHQRVVREESTTPKVQTNNSDVIADNDTFAMSFNSDDLTAKINKFMEKHDSKPTPKPATEIKVNEPTIGEVKKESVDFEMDRLLKNSDRVNPFDQND
jgi:hypothetical protein